MDESKKQYIFLFIIIYDCLTLHRKRRLEVPHGSAKMEPYRCGCCR